MKGRRATPHPAADRGTTCTAVTTVPRDREALKAPGAEPTGISISVQGSESRGPPAIKHRGTKREMALFPFAEGRALTGTGKQM